MKQPEGRKEVRCDMAQVVLEKSGHYSEGPIMIPGIVAHIKFFAVGPICSGCGVCNN